MTIVVEKDAQAYSSGIGSLGTGSFTSDFVTRIPGNIWEFAADHWHEIKESEYSDPILEVVDETGEVLASFRGGSYSRVYFKEALVEA